MAAGVGIPARSRIDIDTEQGMQLDALLLMGHGSRDGDGVAGFLSLVEAVRSRADGWRVEAGVLEFPRPGVASIQEAIDRCAQWGVERIAAVPLLLHDAGHSRDDMPAQLARAREQHPYIDVQCAPRFDLHPALLDATEDRIRQIERALPPADPARTAILLVGRGTTTPLANADFYKAGRLLWERLGYGLVECCFVSLAAPTVPAGIDRCALLGARCVVVMPYFLHTGVLVKRIEQQAAASQQAHPGLEIAVGEPLGTHPNVVGLVLDRARSLLGGGDGASPARREA